MVHYDAVLTPDGGLDPREPIVAYWGHGSRGRPQGRSDLGGKTEGVWKAFGFMIVHGRDANSYHLRLVAQQQRDIYVTKDGNSVRAATLVGGRCAYLNKTNYRRAAGFHAAFHLS